MTGIHIRICVKNVKMLTLRGELKSKGWLPVNGLLLSFSNSFKVFINNGLTRFGELKAVPGSNKRLARDQEKKLCTVPLLKAFFQILVSLLPYLVSKNLLLTVGANLSVLQRCL